MTVERHAIESREQWLAMRQQDLTASDIAAVIGLDPFKSRLRVYAEKTGTIGQAEDNPAMQRGRCFEVGVANMLEEKYPAWVIQKNRFYYRDPEIRLGATPDFVVTAPDHPEGIHGNVQAKIVSRTAFEREWIDRKAPLKHELQTLTEAMLLNPNWSMVAAAILTEHTAELVESPVPRHAHAEERIRQIARDFWANIEAGRAPPADYSIDRQVIEAMHPTGGAGTIDLTHNNRIGELCSERLAWQHRKTNAEGALEEVDAEIKDILGDHEFGEHPQYSISWKLQQRKETVLPATEFRVLRVSRKRP